MAISPFITDDMPAQKAFMECTDRELLYSGAFGAGKSRVLCEKALFLSLLYPGNVGAVVRKTLISLRKTTLVTWGRYVCPKNLIKSFNQEEMKMTLTNGSIIYWLGLDDPDKIGSLEVGWVAIDETIELTEDDYIMLLGRLRLTILIDNEGNKNLLPFRQIMSATNPSSDTHWLYNRAYINKQMTVFESNALVNKHTPNDYKASLKAFTGVYYDRYVLGKWVGAAGIVYNNFDAKKHLIDRFDIPKDWIRYRSIDFGFTNPFTCQWWAVHPKYKPEYNCQCPAPIHDTSYYLYKEIYMSQRTIDQHARDILNNSIGEYIQATFSDWAAGDRASLELCGIPTIKADKSISAGIQSVYMLLGSNRLYLMRNSLIETDINLVFNNLHRPTCLVDEFGCYKYFGKSANNKLNNQEEPIDKDNHGMDAMRYLIHTLNLTSVVSLPILTAIKTSSFGLELDKVRWNDVEVVDRGFAKSKWN